MACARDAFSFTLYHEHANYGTLQVCVFFDLYPYSDFLDIIIVLVEKEAYAG